VAQNQDIGRIVPEVFGDRGSIRGRHRSS
jgi:hypothetical protein